MLFGIPGTRVQAEALAKDSELPLGQTPSHKVTHSPRQQLYSVGAKGLVVWLEVVHAGDGAADNNPERGQEPETECEDGLAVIGNQKKVSVTRWMILVSRSSAYLKSLCKSTVLATRGIG